MRKEVGYDVHEALTDCSVPCADTDVCEYVPASVCRDEMRRAEIIPERHFVILTFSFTPLFPEMSQMTIVCISLHGMGMSCRLEEN